ncbi:MAG: hypothetical protein HY543_07500 [Deltaproteobacteria bacterium]|nr:hypothetical protein [Deltaproteobacteria bacterium]
MTGLHEARTLIAEAQRRHRAAREMIRGLHVPYYRRGEMSIPAFKMKQGGDPAVDGRQDSLKLMKKAAELPVDFFFFDLEDAAPDHPEYKVWARRFVIEAFQTCEFGERVRAFRPNNIRTEYFEEDLCTILPAVGDRVQALVIPKSETADEVKDIARVVQAVQRAAGQMNPIGLEVLIESPKAFCEAERIAAIPQVTALIFGAWDFARTIGGRVEAATWIQDQAVARQWLPIVAAAHGKEAVDAVTGALPIRPKDPHDAEGLARREAAIALARRDAADARRCGYAAKWILHPDQIEPIHAAWTPSRDEALAALRLTADYTRAALRGSGAEVDGSRLADKAVVGTDWWIVRAALTARVLGEPDIAATGFTRDQLERTVVTRAWA